MDPYSASAAQLAATPQLVRQMLHDHSPNPDGCCRAPGCYLSRHPCSLRQLAELARTHLPAPRSHAV